MRLGGSRAAQDRFAALSQQRAAEGQAAGKFDDEIVPITVTRALFDKEGNETGKEQVTLTKDEGVRAGTTYEALQVLMADDGMGPLFEKAVAAALRRSRELAS